MAVVFTNRTFFFANYEEQRIRFAVTILNLGYVGNKATHLNIRTELNQPTPCNATAGCVGKNLPTCKMSPAGTAGVYPEEIPGHIHLKIFRD